MGVLVYNFSMLSNFDFIKNKDKKLFGVIDDAEKLYRDGYFEQAIMQTRKFAEIVCRNILGVRRTTEETFDDMLSTLKDILGENPSDKELIDDMYFIKKQGNLAAHENLTVQDGNMALECLQRAFEVGINYAIKSGFANKKILNSHYSIDILMTGKKYKFSEKYQKIREGANGEGEIEEIVKRAKAPDNKVVEVDFKHKKQSKKKIKKEPLPKNNSKKEPKPTKPKKQMPQKTDSEHSFFYVLAFGVLLILLICIMLFILPF